MKQTPNVARELTDAERFLPTEMLGVIALEHWHRYVFAAQFTQKKIVLDVACGDGYGSDYLCLNAERVYGVDISQTTIVRAKEQYKKPNLEFSVGNCVALPLTDHCVDVVVSFETIEHHNAHAAMISEFKRVLKPGGLLIISSPDKKEYSEKPLYKNPFHVKELFQEEFKALLDASFANVRLLGQRVLFGSVIVPPGGESSVARYIVQEGKPPSSVDFDPVYWVGLASDATVPVSAGGILESNRLLADASANLGRNRVLAQLVRAVALQQSQVLSQALTGDWYKRNNGDVFIKGVDPILHWNKFGAEEGRLPVEDPLALIEALMTERAEWAQSQLLEALAAAGAKEIELSAAIRDQKEKSHQQLNAIIEEGARAHAAERDMAAEQIQAHLVETQAQSRAWQDQFADVHVRLDGQGAAFLSAARDREDQFARQLEALRLDAQRSRSEDLLLHQRHLEQHSAGHADRELLLKDTVAALSEQLSESLRSAEALAFAFKDKAAQIQAAASHELQTLLETLISEREHSRNELRATLDEAERRREADRFRTAERLASQVEEYESRERGLETQLNESQRRLKEQEQIFMDSARTREEQSFRLMNLFRTESERAREAESRHFRKEFAAKTDEFSARERALKTTVERLTRRIGVFERSWIWRMISGFQQSQTEMDRPPAPPAFDAIDRAETVVPATLSQLLTLDDADFVEAAYLAILGRPADSSGRSHYLATLRDRMSKLEIVWALATSSEGTAFDSKLEGLARSMRRMRWRRVPILSHILRQRELNQHLNSEVRRIREEITALQQRLEVSSAALKSFVEFDPDRYLSLNQDVATSDINPYEHYIRFGYQEKRVTRSLHVKSELHLHCDWLGLQQPKARIVGDILVDLIVPVFNGFGLLQPLFESVLANTRHPYRVIIINDCSTDPRVAPLLSEYVAKFADSVLLTNEANLGFIGSVNRGMKTATAEVFVLLNSDVEVPPHWLERLIYPLQTDKSVATATPFSNAATICSFPVSLEDNSLYLDLSVTQIDLAFSSIGYSFPPIQIPTGIGFCMAVRKAVVEEIGAFDEIYGRGYGEENDWCMRAARNGHRHVLAVNLFVYHKHGGSFLSEEKVQLVKRNLETLSIRYPNYHEMIQTYISSDPATSIREFLKIRLLSEVSAGATLIVDHDLGGGANAFRNQLVKSAVEKGRPAVVLTHDALSHDKFLAIAHTAEGEKRFTLPCFGAISELLRTLTIDEIIYNNLVHFRDPLAMIELLKEHGRALGIPLTIMMHDYFPICPSYTLIDKDGNYCGVPENLDVCDSCIKGMPPELMHHRPAFANAREWRTGWGEFMHAASEIRCFSQSSREIVVRAYPDLEPKCSVVPHSVEFRGRRIARIPYIGHLHIGVVGGINHAKGRSVLQSLIQHIETKGLTHRLSVVGQMDIRVAGIVETGRYDLERLPDILEELGVNVILIPSVWPETFSYVTSEMMALGLPVACFDLGAPAERVKSYSKGMVLKSDDPEVILEGLSEICAAVN
ncbi:MAG TPA: glycosyltransferase [Steroidobacteraceae bacterium]|nr:glycosyltransferase [Steroidobacteraceae bacterium]